MIPFSLTHHQGTFTACIDLGEDIYIGEGNLPSEAIEEAFNHILEPSGVSFVMMEVRV